MRRVATISAVILAGSLSACSAGDSGDAVAADSLTRAQRDSALGASSIPGAGGVRRSLDVADSANARQAAIDSIDRK